MVGHIGFCNVDLGGEPHNGIVYSFVLSFLDPHMYPLLIIHGWSAFFAGGCFFIDQDLGSWWREGRLIVIKFFKDLSIDG